MNTFLISDSHFSHKGICKFLRSDGITKERPWDTIEEMDEALIANWNSVVTPKDTVWHLGDVVINRSALPLLSRLNGTKRLVMGNHDCLRPAEYLKYFKDIHGSHPLDGMIMTHIPIHPSSLERWGTNIHGHTHSSSVQRPSTHPSWPPTKDPRYICVSVEQINYTPISLEDLKLKLKEQE